MQSAERFGSKILFVTSFKLREPVLFLSVGSLAVSGSFSYFDVLDAGEGGGCAWRAVPAVFLLKRYFSVIEVRLHFSLPVFILDNER